MSTEPISLPGRDEMRIELRQTAERHVMVYVNGWYSGGLSFQHKEHLTMLHALLNRGPLPKMVKVELTKSKPTVRTGR